MALDRLDTDAERLQWLHKADSSYSTVLRGNSNSQQPAPHYSQLQNLKCSPIVIILLKATHWFLHLFYHIEYFASFQTQILRVLRKEIPAEDLELRNAW